VDLTAAASPVTTLAGQASRKASIVERNAMRYRRSLIPSSPSVLETVLVLRRSDRCRGAWAASARSDVALTAVSALGDPRPTRERCPDQTRLGSSLGARWNGPTDAIVPTSPLGRRTRVGRGGERRCQGPGLVDRLRDRDVALGVVTSTGHPRRDPGGFDRRVTRYGGAWRVTHNSATYRTQLISW